MTAKNSAVFHVAKLLYEDFTDSNSDTMHDLIHIAVTFFAYLVLFGILAGEKFRYGMTFGYSTMNAAPKKALTV